MSPDVSSFIFIIFNFFVAVIWSQSTTTADFRNFHLQRKLQAPEFQSSNFGELRNRAGPGSNYFTRQPSTTTAQERLYQRIISNEQLTRPDLTDTPINVTVRIILIKLQDLVSFFGHENDDLQIKKIYFKVEKNELMETTVRIQIVRIYKSVAVVYFLTECHYFKGLERQTISVE